VEMRVKLSLANIMYRNNMAGFERTWSVFESEKDCGCG